MSERPTRQLVLLVDALGWLTVERLGFMRDRLTFRRRLTTVFGYSSTAIPSLITGAMPVEHGHWFLFRRALGRSSPFREAAWIDRLPGRLGERWRIRVRLEEYWRKKAGIKGYFSLYNTPLSVLPELVPVEMADTWAPGAFPETPSLVDHLEHRGRPYHLSNWRVPDTEKLRIAREAADTGIETVVLYLTGIDSVQHLAGTLHSDLDAAVRDLEAALADLIARMERHGPVGVTLFSDHGMTDVTGGRDLIAFLAARGLERGRDYRGFFDSTVARFWDVRDPGLLTAALEDADWGRLLPTRVLREWGVDFPDRDYGDIFFLADPGLLILPSDMGTAPLAAMHGYDPADPTSDACLLADTDLDPERDHITAVLPALLRRFEAGR